MRLIAVFSHHLKQEALGHGQQCTVIYMRMMSSECRMISLHYAEGVVEKDIHFMYQVNIRIDLRWDVRVQIIKNTRLLTAHLTPFQDSW
jgi:hypothetical protein